jgi:hypothetical protein
VFSDAAIQTVDAEQAIMRVSLRIAGIDGSADEKLIIDAQEIGLTNGSTGTTAANGVAYGVVVSAGNAVVTLSHAGGLSAQQALDLVNTIGYRHAVVVINYS